MFKHFSRLLIFVSCCCSAQQQESWPRFEVKLLSTDNGLSNRIVHTITQDRNGSIWIGTDDGLNRLDGYRIQSFFFQHNKRNSLCNNSIKHLYTAKNQDLWIGTEAGVSVYDYRTNTFKIINQQHATHLHQEFNPFFFSANGHRWILGQRHYYSLSKTNQPKEFDYNGNSTLGIRKGERIDFAVTDQKGTIWGVQRQHLVELDQTDLHPLKSRKIGDQANEGITWLKVIGRKIWISTWGNGLLVFDPASGKFKQIQLKAHIVHHFATYSTTAGDFVIAGTELGYAIINTATFDVQEKDLESEIRCVFVDKTNTVWFATDNGVLYSKQRSSAITTFPLDSWVNELHQTTIDNHRLIGDFFSTENSYFANLIYANGVLEFDKNWRLKRYIPSLSTDPNNIPLRDIRCMYETDTYYWVTTDGGLIKCSKTLKPLTTFIPTWSPVNDPSLIILRTIIPYGKRYLIIRGLQSFSVFDLQNEQFTQVFNRKQARNGSLPNDYIVGEALVGDLLYVAAENNFYTLNLKTKRVEQVSFPFYGKRIRCMTKRGNQLWIGTQTGLLRFDFVTKKWKAFYRTDGLSSDHILQLTTDHQQRLWVATINGLTRFSPETGKFLVINQQNGLTDNVMEGALFIDDRNQCVVSNINSITFIQPQQLIKTNARNTFFTAIQLSGKDLVWQLNRGKKTVRIPYSDQTISLDFSVDGYSTNENQSYYFLLNNHWHRLNSGHIQLNGLESGTYRLEVSSLKAHSPHNDFITIEIIPPFYKTWWFSLLSIIVIAVCLAYFINLRVRNKQRKMHEQEIAEHRLKVAEMQTLRSQMNPHFMFNALNSINRFILVNDSEKASSYLTLFSRLMRNILENSKLAVIPLKKEIDTLCLYIELESARLEQQFDYRIEFPADQELESAEIPPLVLQPFVENAIWHGLHHKTEQGNLTISIQKAGTDGVFIDIIDDGIGRKASQLQKQHRSGHQSLGIAITIDRIRLLNPENKVEIIDLTDENGRATGTHVRIFLNEQT